MFGLFIALLWIAVAAVATWAVGGVYGFWSGALVVALMLAVVLPGRASFRAVTGADLSHDHRLNAFQQPLSAPPRRRG
ncbi:MAG: hypothetical protein VYB54_14130 [Pseudomonadota bacterium]|nr:hypothetical protein [Pseudomonadota bacterium]